MLAGERVLVRTHTARAQAVGVVTASGGAVGEAPTGTATLSQPLAWLPAAIPLGQQERAQRSLGEIE